ncbi:Arsenite efflux pump ArsB, ACR3 family [Pelagirhabdus alkalitolerans]|uniref:Arsenite efflux pump ArsB, ACR3 family n=1 Tax=Pelagirhabdus alkalitolerans TaxID=1612202 RepID=A0A1G6GLR0_9BACI|nr:bile acid:sodium symporter [Pelagirhabdus alkalitolerans]SDB82675.1 Arsenite efflux pump ArsB, ACR3 family [Pelagirhabdus alkalitolerans]
MNRLYVFPQRYLMLSVPLTLVLAFIIGAVADTTVLQPTVLFATIIMIYVTMIGFNYKELTSLKGSKVLLYSLLINFLIVPLIAYGLGMTLLSDHPNMFAGLALSALLPTSGMTISWTAIHKGNVPAAVKLTVFGLVLGSVLTPWYLLVMVGQLVEVDILGTFRTIIMVVFIPMLLGHVTFKFLMKKFTMQEFKTRVKPALAPISIWAMLYIVFVSVSARADMIVNNLELILIATLVLILFYFINFAVSTLFAVKFLDRGDGIALVNGTVLRNLSIAIGLAVASFGAEAALIVTIAFVVQQQGITIYGKLALKNWFAQKESSQLKNTKPQKA